MNINNLLRQNIKSMKAYASARTEFTGQASVFLDANENPFGPAVGNDLNRYPDPLQERLKQCIGDIRNIDAGHIFLGNGSDEPIDLLVRAFCEPGRDHIITLIPTYGMYQVIADLNNVAVKKVALTEGFQPQVTQILKEVNQNTKIIFICSPNNPTGNLADRDLLLELVEKFKGIVVLDEAYIDFAPPGSSMLPLLHQFPNLVILQTCSKAWGMAGLRLGMAFAGKDVIEVLNKIKPPYNINTLTQRYAMDILNQETLIRGQIYEIISLRELLRADLAKVSCVQEIFPSAANFLLVQVTDARAVYIFLLERGIVVRIRSGLPGCGNCLRITVGTASENGLLIQALTEFSKDFNKECYGQ